MPLSPYASSFKRRGPVKVTSEDVLLEGSRDFKPAEYEAEKARLRAAFRAKGPKAFTDAGYVAGLDLPSGFSPLDPDKARIPLHYAKQNPDGSYRKESVRYAPDLEEELLQAQFDKLANRPAQTKRVTVNKEVYPVRQASPFAVKRTLGGFLRSSVLGGASLGGAK